MRRNSNQLGIKPLLSARSKVASVNRRRVLAAIGTAVTAGCSTDYDREHAPVSRSTTNATPTATTAAAESLPSPPEDPTAASARSFVATHEERYVRNALVERDYARSLEVESAAVEVFRETDDGYFLLSSYSGSAESSSGSGSSSRNASGVVHFVASETHKRVPYNGYSCAEFGAATDDDERDDADWARFQLYDFQTEIDYERPESGGRRVDVRVERESGGVVLDRTYETSLPLTVQPGVVARPGRYVLTATLDDGTSIERDWDLATPSTPPWWALAVFVAPDGGLFAEVADPPGDLGLPDGSHCRR